FAGNRAIVALFCLLRDVFKEREAAIDGTEKSCFFAFDERGGFLTFEAEFRVNVGEAFDDRGHNVVQEWRFKAEVSTVADGASENTAKHVAPSFIRETAPVANAERQAADVICDDGIRLEVVLLVERG